VACSLILTPLWPRVREAYARAEAAEQRHPGRERSGAPATHPGASRGSRGRGKGCQAA
jgi:hypothetical protein